MPTESSPLPSILSETLGVWLVLICAEMIWLITGAAGGLVK
jgi:hypothetical protein